MYSNNLTIIEIMTRQSNTLNFILVKLILWFINWGKTLDVNHESDDTQSTNRSANWDMWTQITSHHIIILSQNTYHQ